LKVTTKCPLSYVRQQVALQNELLFCVEIPWPLLHLWSKLLETISSENVNYVDLLNSTVTDGWFVLKSERIEELLRKQAGAVKTAYRRMHGRKWVLLNNKVYKLSVRRGEIESIDIIRSEVSKSCEELEEYKKKYNDLEKERNELFEDMMKEKDI
jgi:uncharacterized protein YecE (DUF72 family)